MIAREPKIKNFCKALDYHRQKLELGKAEILQSSFLSLDENQVKAELRMVQWQHCYLEKNAYHASLNFHPSEEIHNSKMLSIARDYMQEFGFSAHPHMIVRHYDAPHPHVHVLASRIGFDGSLVDDSHDYRRSHEICRALEEKYELRKAPGLQQSEKKGLSIAEVEMVLHTGEPSTKMLLQEMVGEILQKNLSLEQFIREAERKKIYLQFRQDEFRKVTGITYGYKGRLITGRGLGNGYKWKNMEEKLQYNQRQHERLVQRVNEKTEQKFGRLERHQQPHLKKEKEMEQEMEIRKDMHMGRSF
ncbi:MAG: relaxase/mobilization nuclease [Chitinophagaceae bacterium]|nr:relaxase/mobilization nuclease [Chitinophagaceae bacterium]